MCEEERERSSIFRHGYVDGKNCRGEDGGVEILKCSMFF